MTRVPTSWGNRLAVLLSAVFVLAACGGGNNTATTSPGPPGSPIGKFSGNLSLLRWAGDPWEGATKDAASRWSQATGANLTVDAIPYENLHEKQVLSLSSKSGSYSILYVHPSWFGEYAKAGYLKPIDGYLKDSSMNPAGFTTDQYVPNIFKQGNYNGKQYCFQDFAATVLLAYRKDVYQKYNLQAPKSWDDVIANAKALDGKDGMSGIALPGKKTGAVADVMSSLISSQGTWWYDTSAKTSLDVDKATQAVQFYVNAAKYAPTGVLNFHWDEAATAAAQGKAAQLITLTPTLAWLQDPAKSKTVGLWDYAALTYQGKPGGELIYWNWCIAADAKDPKAAYSFLQWFTGGSEQAKIAPKAATGGSTKDFYENKDLAQSLPFLPAMQLAFQNSNPQPSLANWPKIQDQIELDVQDAISGKKTPSQAAQAMHDQLVAGLGG